MLLHVHVQRAAELLLKVDLLRIKRGSKFTGGLDVEALKPVNVLLVQTRSSRAHLLVQLLHTRAPRALARRVHAHQLAVDEHTINKNMAVHPRVELRPWFSYVEEDRACRGRHIYECVACKTIVRTDRMVKHARRHANKSEWRDAVDVIAGKRVEYDDEIVRLLKGESDNDKIKALQKLLGACMERQSTLERQLANAHKTARELRVENANLQEQLDQRRMCEFESMKKHVACVEAAFGFQKEKKQAPKRKQEDSPQAPLKRTKFDIILDTFFYAKDEDLDSDEEMLLASERQRLDTPEAREKLRAWLETNQINLDTIDDDLSAHLRGESI